ncbi:MAG: CYTH domain-containing protein, partial [Caulobacteraceae bacterium]
MTRRDAFEIETMAVGEPVETELKFQVGPRGLGKLAAHPAFAAAAEDKRLRSVYFDTPQGALWAAGFSLRVREAGGAFVQTVKQAGAFAGFSRGEWECQTASGRPDLAALAQTPAAGRLGGDTAALRPVFTTTVRRATRLWREGAAVIELSLDVGQIRAGKTVWAIRELELELKAGTPDALFALARGLIEIAPLRLAFDSKAERGWRLAR